MTVSILVTLLHGYANSLKKLNTSECVNLHKCLTLLDSCRIHATRWDSRELGRAGSFTFSVGSIFSATVRFPRTWQRQICVPHSGWGRAGFTHQRSEVERYARSSNFKASSALR
jgi:hypothetical protein